MENKNRSLSWTPFSDNLKNDLVIVDNELEKSVMELGIFQNVARFGLVKTKGSSLRQVLFSLFIWPLLTMSSLSFFCGNRMSAFLKGGKDVLYDFLKRQDIDWRGYRRHAARQLYKRHRLAETKIRAATFDDTIKHRRGKKVAATSSHFDHTLGKHVMGQQVLEMGLATEKGYVPLDSRVYVGEKKRQYGKNAIVDYRRCVGREYAAAMYGDKNELFRDSLKRAINAGFDFTHVLADSWFGNKENIKSAVSSSLTAIFRMKRGNLRYVLNDKRYTVTELYALIKRRMTRLGKSRYRTYALNVYLDLSQDKKNPDLLPIRLVFSSAINQQKDNWVVFLSTDIELSAEEILEIYALRWSVEVYFKEVKQHFGFLKEQTGDYAVHFASIHLAAIRFILIAHGALSNGVTFGRVRDKITKQLEYLTFARLLWELFRALIFGVLDSLREIIPSATLVLIKSEINSRVTAFLDQALQLDEKYVLNELKAEAIGAL